VVCSASDDSINDGEIIVIGSEVAESENKQMPLGLVILIAGRALTEEDRFALLNYSIPADLCERVHDQKHPRKHLVSNQL
jgi:hypothetical protein